MFNFLGMSGPPARKDGSGNSAESKFHFCPEEAKAFRERLSQLRNSGRAPNSILSQPAERRIVDTKHPSANLPPHYGTKGHAEQKAGAYGRSHLVGAQDQTKEQTF